MATSFRGHVPFFFGPWENDVIIRIRWNSNAVMHELTIDLRACMSWIPGRRKCNTQTEPYGHQAILVDALAQQMRQYFSCRFAVVRKA